MTVNYHQLEALARIHHEERLALAAKQRLIQRNQPTSLPIAAWWHWLGEQKNKWTTTRHIRPQLSRPANRQA